MEPNLQNRQSCSNTDLVTIAITLNPAAAQVSICFSDIITFFLNGSSLLMTSLCVQNVAGVMAVMTQLLRVPTPLNYQLSRTVGIERGLVAGMQVPLPQVSSAHSFIRINFKMMMVMIMGFIFTGSTRPQTAESTPSWTHWSVPHLFLSFIFLFVCYPYSSVMINIFLSCRCQDGPRSAWRLRCSQTSVLQLLQGATGKQRPHRERDKTSKRL